MDWLYRFDFESFRRINVDMRQPWLDPVFLVLAYTGLGAVLTPAALSFAIWKPTRRFVIPLLLAMLLGGFVVADGTKEILARDRPSNLSFAVVQEPFHQGSFPSGHSSTAGSFAMVLLLLTWGTPQAKWGWVAVAWAVLVGVSRIYRGVHWPTDVIAGLFAGALAGAASLLILRGLRVNVGPA